VVHKEAGIRNFIIVTIFAPQSLTATFIPLLVMSVVAGLFIVRDNTLETKVTDEAGVLKLDSPISIKNVLSFGILFIIIEVGGTLLNRFFGTYGLLATGVIGGLVSSAGTTAAAATMAMHGNITSSLAGNVAIVSSLASAVINLPIIWRIIKDKAIVKKLTVELVLVIATGIGIVALDRIFAFSDFLLQK
jgi:uncharacterized membrane protein (DUF4010 family)